jgi:hypothetical protein
MKTGKWFLRYLRPGRGLLRPLNRVSMRCIGGVKEIFEYWHKESSICNLMAVPPWPRLKEIMAYL